ncbi:MAG: LL-diaminopimelate aminotransferase [Phycisphaerae bacterium]|nr:LL-diaminopimelate aminotransferase [Phycisphaerae bacterium]
MPITIPTPQRLAALPPYLFVDIDRKKQALRAAGKDVIDFGIGDPDRPTPRFIVDRLAEAIHQPANHRYPANKGSAAFRQSVCRFMDKRYGVKLDPETQALALIGSKEGIGHLPLALVEPGQGVLVPSPAYPVYHSATLFAGGRPITMPLRESNAWHPDFDAISPAERDAAVLMFLNYPNNPTGATCTIELLERAVAFCRKHDILLAHDAAYNEMYYGHASPPSVLQVPGASEIAIELHSLSKTFNMTGWRIGFAVGNAAILERLAKVKANLDSSQFNAIQDAACVGLDRYDDAEIDALRKMYIARRDALCPTLRELGFRLSPPEATFYVWCGVPKGYDSFSLASKLLDEAAIVCIPGPGFGECGAGYVRFALTIEAERIAEAAKRLRALKW